MEFALSVRVQTVLEGVALPAAKAQLVAYARAQGDEEAVHALQSVPDREYRSLDDVGEELAPVQPDRGDGQVGVPRAESGRPPGGDAYTELDPETGRVREGTSTGPHDEGLSGEPRRRAPGPER